MHLRVAYIYPKILYWQALHTWSIRDIELLEEIIALNTVLFMVVG